MTHRFSTAWIICCIYLFPTPPSAFGQQRQQVQPGAPVEYEPFFPDEWKARNRSTRMIPWEGEHVALFTTSANFDPRTMAVFLRRLDAGWLLYADLVGQPPAPGRLHNGKALIVAVPDPDYIRAMGRGSIGTTGIEVAGFYDGDYALVRAQPDAFPHYLFYEMGRNYFVFGDRHSEFATGFAVFMRNVCMDTLSCRDPDAETRKAIEAAESRVKRANLNFLQAFTSAGGETGDRLTDLHPSDRAVMYASAMLKMRRDYGQNAWVKRFFRYLLQCPEVSKDVQDGAAAQCLIWLVAASCAAGQDLSGLWVDRWNMPLGRKTRAVLHDVDWRAADLAPANVIAALPADEVPAALAMLSPNYLTAARRRANVLVDSSFENANAKRWSVLSWRQNSAAVRIQSDDAKSGKNAVAITSVEPDDARYTQKVRVKPNTHYLLAGWIKTNDVTVVQSGGRIGACLCLEGGYEASRSLVGDNGWTYVTLQFNSGNRTAVTICARLGFYGSTATGSAWFDDLVLIEAGTPAGKR